jgi:hypothetical protein
LSGKGDDVEAKDFVPLEQEEGAEVASSLSPSSTTTDVGADEDWLAAEVASGTTFASSGAMMLTEAQDLHPMARSIAILVLVVSLLGFVNGLDFASPETGLVRPDEFVYAMTAAAPDDSAVFRGTVVDVAGQPVEGVLLYLSWEDDGIWRSSESTTDANGTFRMENLTPSLTRVDLILERGNNTDVLSHRVLLSPPALFEPYGFTSLEFTFPSASEFAAAPCNNGADECEIREIDMTPFEMDHPLMDPSAAGLYILLGFGFMGLALIAGGFATAAMLTGSEALVRIAAVLSLFTMGHFYSACILGTMAVVLTFLVPKRFVPLTT